jgi:hypothetical protein
VGQHARDAVNGDRLHARECEDAVRMEYSRLPGRMQVLEELEARGAVGVHDGMDPTVSRS